MRFHRFFSAALLVAAGAFAAGAAAQTGFGAIAFKSPVVTTEQVRAELLAWAPEGVEAGKPVWLGLQLAHQPEWHTYWKNSGDSGLPTALQWQLPAGVIAGDIAWPAPKKIPIGTLANYGYEHTVLLPVPLTIATGFDAAQLDVNLKASWLVCRKECIPQEGAFSLSLPVRGSTAASSAAFQAAFAAAPESLLAGSSQAAPGGKLLKVSLAGLPAALQGQMLEVFPETAGIVQPAGAWQQAWKGPVWTAQLPLSDQRTDSPARLPLVVVAGAGAYRIDAPVVGAWPESVKVTAVPAALEAALRANTAASGAVSTAPVPAPAAGWLAALLGAFLGGLILNLMPCVFPVLAIKLVGFVNEKSQAARLASGLAYSTGVVLSFLALGGLLLGLRAAGDQLGWGFQLQNPAVVAALAALFTLIGLNLAGLFEFGNLLPERLASAQPKNPTAHAFLSGVLATAVASPCTAPFMGASLGLAVGLPAGQALAVFGAIGIGMALPYLVASSVPAVARALPRPGAWMVTFRQLMAFPMFATVAWLVWVLGQQTGIDGAGALLALLVLLALAVWAIGLRGRGGRLVAGAAVAAGIWGLVAIGPALLGPVDAPATSASARWQDWQPGRVEQLGLQGRSVFVDFTAAWCVTCQYNKKTALADPSVLAAMDAGGVALLRADWTRRDPAVTQALQALGRSGVPVYVFYRPGRAPVVLSEILSVAQLHQVLAGT